jgi:hypothetical protein
MAASLRSLRIGSAVLGGLLLSVTIGVASEQPGPSGSVGRSGGGSGGPSGRGGTPEGQMPVDPAQTGSGVGNPSEPGSGKITQNPPAPGSGTKGAASAGGKAKEKK